MSERNIRVAKYLSVAGLILMAGLRILGRALKTGLAAVSIMMSPERPDALHFPMSQPSKRDDYRP